MTRPTHIITSALALIGTFSLSAVAQAQGYTYQTVQPVTSYQSVTTPVYGTEQTYTAPTTVQGTNTLPPLDSTVTYAPLYAPLPPQPQPQYTAPAAPIYSAPQPGYVMPTYATPPRSALTPVTATVKTSSASVIAGAPQYRAPAPAPVLAPFHTPPSAETVGAIGALIGVGIIGAILYDKYEDDKHDRRRARQEQQTHTASIQQRRAQEQRERQLAREAEEERLEAQRQRSLEERRARQLAREAEEEHRERLEAQRQRRLEEQQRQREARIAALAEEGQPARRAQRQNLTEEERRARREARRAARLEANAQQQGTAPRPGVMPIVEGDAIVLPYVTRPQ